MGIRVIITAGFGVLPSGNCPYFIERGEKI